MELNPNHPVTQQLHEQWHKLAILIMIKNGDDHVVITGKYLEKLSQIYPGDLPAITICEKEDGIHLRIISQTEGALLARKEGGLPT